MGRLQVNMLGTSFTIRAKEDDEYLEKLYTYYREITGTIGESKSLTDPLQISILAGITLVDELIKSKTANLLEENGREDEYSAEDEIAGRLAEQMIDKINQVI